MLNPRLEWILDPVGDRRTLGDSLPPQCKLQVCQEWVGSFVSGGQGAGPLESVPAFPSFPHSDGGAVRIDGAHISFARSMSNEEK